VRSLSQADLALLIGSGQARVSKLERSLESTSLDTLFRCLLALGALRQDLAKTIGRSPRPKKAVDEKDRVGSLIHPKNRAAIRGAEWIGESCSGSESDIRPLRVTIGTRPQMESFPATFQKVIA
jgi:transcriptional regulator with XRE-family HTH domain